MRKIIRSSLVYWMIAVLLIFVIKCSRFRGKESNPEKPIKIDYSMPIEVSEWLRLLKMDNDYLDVKDYFLEKVINTPGCKAALQYLNNFKKIDGKDFYKIIIEALYASTEQKMYNFDGYFTSYGRMKNIWLNKLAEPGTIIETINTLKEENISAKSESLLAEYLPEDKLINSRFYFYAYGDIESPLMGMKNGLDIFSLPVDDQETIEFGKIINKISRWAFQESFDQYTTEINKDIYKEEKVHLIQILAKSGLALYFFNDTDESFIDDSKYYLYDYPEIWEIQKERLPELYILADRDLQNCLKGEVRKDEITSYWLKGKVSPASVLGYDMAAKIDTYLGRDKLIDIVSDYRKLIFYYDRAANAAYSEGREVYIFDKRLVYNVAFYTGKDY